MSPNIYQVLESLREARLQNEIVILLRSNYHLPANSLATISGLTGSATPDSLLPVTFPADVPVGVAAPAVVLGVWNQR